MIWTAIQQQWQELVLYEKKVKFTILRYTLKIVNTLMQKASNVKYRVIQVMVNSGGVKGDEFLYPSVVLPKIRVERS